MNWQSFLYGVFAVVFIAAIVLGILALPGCASPYQALDTGIKGGQATLDATTILVGTGKMKGSQAKPVYDAAVSVEAGLKGWYTAIVSKGDVAIAEASVNQALQTLLTDLRAASPAEARLKATTLPAKLNAQISAPDVISIVAFVLQVAPQLESWINTAFGITPVTDAMIQQDFANYDASKAALLQAIQKAGN